MSVACDATYSPLSAARDHVVVDVGREHQHVVISATSGIASSSVNAMEYGSSPDEQAADQIRTRFRHAPRR